MKEAGLTHGGFYTHFEDRDELLAEAVTFAGNETGTRVLGPGTPGARGMLEAYLSPEHAAHPEDGCVLAALGTEGAHQPPKLRRTFPPRLAGSSSSCTRSSTPAAGRRCRATTPSPRRRG